MPILIIENKLPSSIYIKIMLFSLYSSKEPIYFYLNITLYYMIHSIHLINIYQLHNLWNYYIFKHFGTHFKTYILATNTLIILNLTFGCIPNIRHSKNASLVFTFLFCNSFYMIIFNSLIWYHQQPSAFVFRLEEELFIFYFFL